MSPPPHTNGSPELPSGMWRSVDRLLTGDAEIRHSDPLLRRRYRMSCWIAFGAFLIITPLALFDLFFTGYLDQAASEAAVALIMGGSWIALRRGRLLDPIPLIISLGCGGLILHVIATSHPDDQALVWAPLFPILPLYLMGVVRGLPIIVLHFFILLRLLLGGSGDPSETAIVNTAGCYLAAFALALYYETGRVHVYRQLSRVAETDALTEILNTRGFRRRFEAEASRSRRGGTALSLLLFDIDHFKRINDRYGHDVGDEAIRHIARLLLENCRRYDAVGRLGGEEFAVLLPETPKERAAVAAEKLRRVVADTPLVGEWGRIEITISAGVSELSDADNDQYSALFARADRRLYRAKADGRNRVATA